MSGNAEANGVCEVDGTFDRKAYREWLERLGTEFHCTPIQGLETLIVIATIEPGTANALRASCRLIFPE